MIPLSCGCLLAALAAAAATTDQLVPGFEAPSAEHRPKFRYWLPDAAVDHGVLANDVRALKHVGAGGLEFVPFYNYGFPALNLNQSDRYAFGKPAFVDVFRAALEAAKENGLSMDFALGASQGQGVPVEPLTPGLAMQLVYGKMTVKGGERVQGELPAPDLGWREELGFIQPQEHFGPSRLVGVSAAAVSSKNQSDDGDVHVVLHPKSLVDLSKNVTGGKLTWLAPADHQEYVVFAIYERYTNQRSAVGLPSDVIANGSWVTDHFSAAGAKLVSEFWEQNILTPEVRELLKLVGQHSWEDSMEIQAALFWSPDFVHRFKTARGYDPVKYLPLMFDKSTSFQLHRAPYNTTFYLDRSEGNSAQAKYLQDYRLTLNEGYMEYLKALGEWAATIGLSHSCQVGYGVPLDMLAAVPSVAGPELESLAFTTVDQMLQFVGPAHLGRRTVVSTEVGAAQSGGYSQAVPSLLRLFHDAFASGVNAMIIHGMPYGGEQPGATWPGFTPFQFVYSELWGPRQPAWEHMGDVMNYTARNQLILRSGVTKRDLVFYLYRDPYSLADARNATDLRAKGFTYEYLSPANFASDNVTVQDGLLDFAGSGYRALVLDQQKFITPDAAAKLVELAKAGLPIVVVGALPNMTIGSIGQDVVSRAMSDLASAGYPNLKFIASSDSLLEALDVLSVKPRVQVTALAGSTNDLHMLWRSDGPISYLFLYNRGPSAATFNVSVEASDDDVAPHRLDAWTGIQEAVAIYSRSAGRLHLPVSLQQSQTTILMFGGAAGAPRDHILSHSQNVVGARYGSDNKISVVMDDAAAGSVTLSNGSWKPIPALAQATNNATTALPAIEVGPWNLTLQSWVPGPDLSKSESAKQTLHLGLQHVLVPWSEMLATQNVSGVGIYTATFERPGGGGPSQQQLPGSSGADDAITVIEFGQVLNTLRVWINGRQLPAVDVFGGAAPVDISQYLVAPGGGPNSIRVEVASTLFNAVKARVDFVKTNGVGPNVPQFYTAAAWQPHGLVGPVRVRTLRKVTL